MRNENRTGAFRLPPVKPYLGWFFSKILVATTETQGRRRSDFCHAKEGELLYFPKECEGEDMDAPCGCKRSLIGIETNKTTTTFKVVENGSMTVDWCAEMILPAIKELSLEAQESIERIALKQAEALLHIAGRYRAGTILERRGERFLRRTERRPGTKAR